MAISAVRGIYRNGKIEPLEDIQYIDEKNVIILFLDNKKDDIIWDEIVAKDFMKGYSNKDSAYDKL